MNMSNPRFNVHAAVGTLAVFVALAAIATPAHAGGFYGPRNTIPTEPLPAARPTCGAVFALSLTGPRTPRLVKVGDLGPCPIRKVERWVGPRATIPVYKK